MVDVERAAARLERLEELIERLEAIGAGGEEEYLANAELRATTERWLQVAIQTCIDLGAQLVSERSATPPSDYAGVFESLADAGALDRELAAALARAARQRNVLVHLYLDVDDREVFATLGRLDALRDFAAAVQRLID